MNINETALIVIDSGFSVEAIARAKRVIAIYDVPRGRKVVGEPVVSSDALAAFAGDPMHHGTIVLEKLLDVLPEAPVILVRAFGDNNSVSRTEWAADGGIAREGWTEAYVWAVEVCRSKGLRSVANCSFGGFIHAMDGTGWESFQLAKATGPGMPNHVVVVAAGPGDGRASHASWKQLRNDTVTVSALQHRTSKYNVWAGKESDETPVDWTLTVMRDGDVLHFIDGAKVPENMWNQRRQSTFSIDGSGFVQFVMQRKSLGDTGGGDSEGILGFDIWLGNEGTGAFLDHVDSKMISEPAIFPHVIAVGLNVGIYAPDQTVVGAKPEVLVHGRGQVSFQTPRVTAKVAQLLMESEAGLDIDQVRERLGKYPDLG